MSQLQKLNTGLLIGLFLFLSGCGQKGDLYLPGQKDASLDQHSVFYAAQTQYS